MSLLINGVLKDDWEVAQNKDGEYVRKDSQFRSYISPESHSEYPAEKDRYHLFVSYACPWAHRTLVFRQLKGLEKLISVSVVNPEMGEEGWSFKPYPDATGDHLYNSTFMHELYTRARPDYTGIVTVPVLWDKKTESIVNNESSEIIRIFNSAFDHLTGNSNDYYPLSLRDEIDAINQTIYDNVNNGVYRTGFASTQDAYEKAFKQLFATLEELEDRLSASRYLLGNTLTEADFRLITTLLRFDPVYVGHFKCNKKRIVDYPNLYAYLRDLYSIPAVKNTFHIEHIKRHYYWSHTSINPKRIVPCGPDLDYEAPHDRDRF